MPLGPFVDLEVGYRFASHGGSIDMQRPEQVGQLWTRDLPEGLGCVC